MHIIYLLESLEAYKEPAALISESFLLGFQITLGYKAS